MKHPETLTADQLAGILENYSIEFDDQRGDGLYRHFFTRRGALLTRAVPLGRPIVQAHIRTLREHFKLEAEDGVSDEEFYSFLDDSA